MSTMTTEVSLAAQALNVTKHHGWGATAVCALDHVDMSLPTGQFTAIMGPSGSGKSTLVHCLAGLDTVDSGVVRIGDTDVTMLNEHQRAVLRRTQVGFVFQAFNLVASLNARENILLPLTLAGQSTDAKWFGELVSTLRLTDRLHHMPSELSGGQQQRVAVARALVSRPQIVFADEPTGSLDSRSSRDLLQLLRGAVDEFGQTVVMVTHDPSAAAHADRVVFLADGRIVDELFDPRVHTVLNRMRLLDHGDGAPLGEATGAPCAAS